MKTNWLGIACEIVLICCIAGCIEIRKDDLKVTAITYTSESGTILPELQWYEEIHITVEKAILTRKGKTADTQVNAGTWEITMDKDSVNHLFEQLQSIDCSKLKRIEAADPPDGGGTESYLLTYDNGNTCMLYFHPGTIIVESEEIVHPVSEFILRLTFPPVSGYWQTPVQVDF